MVEVVKSLLPETSTGPNLEGYARLNNVCLDPRETRILAGLPRGHPSLKLQVAQSYIAGI